MYHPMKIVPLLVIRIALNENVFAFSGSVNTRPKGLLIAVQQMGGLLSRFLTQKLQKN